jgi:SAM-dependent methyltransferase
MLGDELPDTSAYYETDYRILLDHDDEDQIYEVRDNQIVYRTDHQAATLLDKVEIREGALLLDYGCAKASTPKRLLARRADIQVHLFDVSGLYVTYWDRFVSADRRALHQLPQHWLNRFDIVTSFFALEHIPEPRKTARNIANLLADDGVFYGIVPDTFGNVADFIVIDHVNHFTTMSLRFLLMSAGFKDIRIDAGAHRGALVFTARKQGTPAAADDLEEINRRSAELANYWTATGKRVRSSEYRNSGRTAIYGSGFYGAFIYSVLANPENVACFLDRSPFQQDKKLFGKAIVAPDKLPEDVSALYVGLNPAIARETMAEMNWLHNPGLHLIYLDEEETEW